MMLRDPASSPALRPDYPHPAAASAAAAAAATAPTAAAGLQYGGWPAPYCAPPYVPHRFDFG